MRLFSCSGNIVENLKGDVLSLQERKYTVAVRGKKYPVVLHPDMEDGGYWTECPSLPGCASQGDTAEEALEMIKDAIKGHLEVVEKDKKGRKAL
jgi:predicted RNase H-like HicB family nuclease